jgi:hypothetical protein
MASKQGHREARHSTPIEDPAQLQAIINAISELDRDELEKRGAWTALDELSSNTTFEAIEPHPNGIFQIGKKHFEAVATVYVTLNYGGAKDRTSMSDSYPAKVAGTVESKNNVEINSITVDTTSFYQ